MKLELSIQQINIILAGLQELPHKHSDAVIRHIGQQIEEANKPAEPPSPPAPPIPPTDQPSTTEVV